MSASDSPHPVPVARPPRSGGILLIGALIFLAVVVAGAFLFVMQTNANKTAEQGDATRLRERLAADEERLTALERPKPDDGVKAVLAQSQSDLAALTTRVAKLEAAPDPQALVRLDASDRRLADLDLRLAALERNSQLSDLPQRVAALQAQQAALVARIAHLESLDPSAIMKRAAAEIALANLVRASSAAEPFAAELQTFGALMPKTREVAGLAGIASHGAPTQATLAARFPALAAQALAAERTASAKTWLGRLWANIGNLVVVRRVGERKGMDSDAILSRAGARLNEGQLDGAIAELKNLKGAARTTVLPWLEQAEARSGIERDTVVLARHMAAALAAP